MREHEGTSAPTLRRWLATRTSSERATLARLWSLPPTVAQSSDTMAEAMLRPEAVERLMSSLGARDRAALARVQEYGGTILMPVLEREFGTIRAHEDYPNPRAYLLALEQPPSPVERLYLLAFIQPLRQGIRRSYTIPPDLLALLPPVPLRDPTPHVVIAEDPPEVAAADAHDSQRYLLTILTLARDDQLEVIPSGGLNKASLVRLARQWNKKATLKGTTREEHWPYIQFLRQVAQGAGLLRVGSAAQLRPTREAVEWLRQPLLERTRRLLDGWIASDWDELAVFGGVKAQRDYFRDLPHAKREVVRLLRHIPPGQWIAFDTFAAAIKEVNPDFARPDGNYGNWNLINYLRQPLDGFEHWEDVEGAQLSAIAGGTLHWMGLTDLGIRDERSISFRINALGAALLESGPAPHEPPVEPLVVQPNFEVIIPAYASLYARFQISRIAEHLRDDTAAIYRLTKRSIQGAVEHGLVLDDILGFLREQGERELPQNIVATLRDWAGEHGQVTIRPGVLLEAREAALLEQIRRDKRVKLPQIEELTDRIWLVQTGDGPALSDRLRKAGYGLAGTDVAVDAPLSEHDLTVLFSALEFYIDACALLGVDNDASAAMVQRLLRLLPEKQRNRAYQSSRDLLRRLKTQLGESISQSDKEPGR